MLIMGCWHGLTWYYLLYGLLMYGLRIDHQRLVAAAEEEAFVMAAVQQADIWFGNFYNFQLCYGKFFAVSRIS